MTNGPIFGNRCQSMSKEDEYMRVIKSQSGRLQQVRKQVLVRTVVAKVAFWWKPRSLSLPPHTPESMPSSELVFIPSHIPLPLSFQAFHFLTLDLLFPSFPHLQAEARAEFAERSVQKLQKEVDRLEGELFLVYAIIPELIIFSLHKSLLPQTSWCTRRRSTSQSRTSWTRPLPSSPATRHLPPHRYHSIPGHNLDKQTHLPAQSVTIQISCALFPLYIYIIYYIRLHSLTHTQLCMPNTFTTNAANGQQSKRRTTAPPNCNSTTTPTTDTDCIITLF